VYTLMTAPTLACLCGHAQEQEAIQEQVASKRKSQAPKYWAEQGTDPLAHLHEARGSQAMFNVEHGRVKYDSLNQKVLR
jgi:hypothetical protein